MYTVSVNFTVMLTLSLYVVGPGLGGDETVTDAATRLRFIASIVASIAKSPGEKPNREAMPLPRELLPLCPGLLYNLDLLKLVFSG